MCVCPIRVKNNKLDFDPFVDRFYNYVPCGHCYECQESIQNGYEVRLMFEYYHNSKIHGCVYYFTLTYNNDYVPFIPNTNIKCFSKRHLQLFFKKIRHLLPNFKYFVVSEYGHKTFRPHYHALLFLESLVDWKKVVNVVSDNWIYGMVNFNINHGLVTDIRPMSYVSKYCVKDVAFENRLRGLENNSAVVHFLCNQRDYDVNLYPFHLQSQRLGYDIVHYLKDIDYIKGYFVRNDIVGIQRKLTIPLYILRLTLYERYYNSNNTISYRLNAYGKKIFFKKLNYQYNKLHSDYRTLFSLAKNIDVYNSSISIKRYFTFDYWCNLCDYFLAEGFTPIICYKLLYHDVSANVPFEFQNFHSDLQIYIDCVLSPDWVHAPMCEKREVPFAGEIQIILDCLADVTAYFRYQNYVRNVTNYNCAQLHRSLKTKEKKLKYICTYNEFRNNNNLNYFYHVRLLKEKETLPDGFDRLCPSAYFSSGS